MMEGGRLSSELPNIMVIVGANGWTSPPKLRKLVPYKYSQLLAIYVQYTLILCITWKVEVCRSLHPLFHRCPAGFIVQFVCAWKHMFSKDMHLQIQAVCSFPMHCLMHIAIFDVSSSYFGLSGSYHISKCLPRWFAQLAVTSVALSAKNLRHAAAITTKDSTC